MNESKGTWMRQNAMVCCLNLIFFLLFSVLTALPGCLGAYAQTENNINFKVLAGSKTSPFYESLTVPFWLKSIQGIKNFRLKPNLMTFEEAGIASREAFTLVQMGAVDFALLPLDEIAEDDTYFAGAILPGMNRHVDELNESLEQWHPYLSAVLSQHYGLRLLALLPGPPVTIQCHSPFKGLDDLVGRRVGVAGQWQFLLMKSLGARAIIIADDHRDRTFQQGDIECQLGVMQRKQIDRSSSRPYTSALPLDWRAMIIVVNERFWSYLPEQVRDFLSNSLHNLQYSFLSKSRMFARDVQVFGSGCDECDKMGGYVDRLVIPSEKDDAILRKSLSSVILPQWGQGCGRDCVEEWNQMIGEKLGIAGSYK